MLRDACRSCTVIIRTRARINYDVCVHGFFLRSLAVAAAVVFQGSHYKTGRKTSPLCPDEFFCWNPFCRKKKKAKGYILGGLRGFYSFFPTPYAIRIRARTRTNLVPTYPYRVFVFRTHTHAHTYVYNVYNTPTKVYITLLYTIHVHTLTRIRIVVLLCTQECVG